MKPTIESDWEALLTEMRKAREYGVPWNWSARDCGCGAKASDGPA
jgi:hypothetical protein